MKDWSGMWFFSMQKRCIKETYLVQDFSIVRKILKILKDRLKSFFMYQFVGQLRFNDNQSNSKEHFDICPKNCVYDRTNSKLKNDISNCMAIDIKLKERLYDTIFSM